MTVAQQRTVCFQHTNFGLFLKGKDQIGLKYNYFWCIKSQKKANLYHNRVFDECERENRLYKPSPDLNRKYSYTLGRSGN